MDLLQKTNIIHGFREDVDQQRYSWLRGIFGKEEYGFKGKKGLCSSDVGWYWMRRGMRVIRWIMEDFEELEC